jgi:ribosomal protein S18 acetylase RimI-like enzyme
VILRDVAVDELPAAAAVLGDGMRDNPIHVRVFGNDASARQSALTRLFEGALNRITKKGAIEGAYLDGQLVAVCGRLPPGHCRISFADKLRFLPSMLSANSVPTVYRIFSWAGAWGTEDPSAAHWHVGPVGVLRSHQGKGIGTALLRAFAARMDQERSTAYLETDREANVPFYERAGFAVVGRKDVLEVPCWFMSRPPAGI